MGVACIFRDPFSNDSCASPQRQQELLGSRVDRTLEAARFALYFAQPVIVAQVHNLGLVHLVFRLFLIAPSHDYLCLKCDPLCDGPHTVRANQEEFAVVDLIAEQEGIQPQQQKKWAKILDVFRGLAVFPIAFQHSTLISQSDGVSCHQACLLKFNCVFSRRVVNGIL